MARGAQAGYVGAPAQSTLFGQITQNHTASVQHTASARSSGRRVGQSRQGLTFVPRASDGEGDSESFEIDLKVTGMACEGCADSVRTVLGKLAEVKAVEVELESGVVTVEVIADTMGEVLAALPALVGAITDAGFEAEPLIA